MRTRIKNKFHAARAKNGLQGPHSDLSGKAGRACLEELKLPEVYRQQTNGCLRALDCLAGEVFCWLA